MILILTAPHDHHADHVAAKLRERGDEFIRFDPAAFPREAEIALAHSPEGGASCMLRLAGREVDLGRVRSVWNRRPDPPVAHPEIVDPVVRGFVEGECKTFVRDVLTALDCFWLPAPPWLIVQAQLKGAQLKVARDVGFEVPATLVTNSEAELLELYRRQNGKIVSKLAGFSLFETMGATLIRYTEVVSKRDLAHARALRYCPMIFQQYIPKRFELRVTVVGRRVYAAEIHSQASHHTRLDWRRYDTFQTPYLAHQLPGDIEHRCVALVEKLGLCYGAIDLILTPDGRYVFLEVNPNGQYLWIESATGLPISDAICDLLTAGCRGEA